MKLDRSKIMTHAWKYYRAMHKAPEMNFSKALKYAWESAKRRNYTSIEVRDLRPGMVLSFTGDVVKSTPISGVSTGRGKMDFVVKTKRGSMVQKSWNRHTLIAVAN